jgi:hypothetical protein
MSHKNSNSEVHKVRFGGFPDGARKEKDGYSDFKTGAPRERRTHNSERGIAAIPY